MTDATVRVNLLAFASCKCGHIVLLLLRVGTYALADIFEAAYSITHYLQKLLRRSVSIKMLTDSETLPRSLLKCSTTEEKGPTIDTRATREAYENVEITNIGCIRSNQNIADGLTKVTHCDAPDDVLPSRVLNIKIEQCIERATPTTSDEKIASVCNGLLRKGNT